MMSDGFPGDLTMNNEIPADKNRDDIEDLRGDIQKSMENGFRLLIFTRRLERRFLSDTLNLRKARFLIMGIIAVFIYNLFLITDREMLPDVYLTAWKIRLWIVTPAMIVVLILMRSRAFARFLDIFVDFLILLTSASIILMLELSHHPNVVHYHTGIILIIMFGNIIVRLRFWHAFWVSWLTFLLYVLTVSRITPMPPPVMINSSVVLFSAIIISLIANYQMENDLRWNYLRNLLKEIETLGLEKAKAELEHLSSSDVLTGLANRRHFDALLDAEWRMGIRNGTCYPSFFLMLMTSKPTTITMVIARRCLPPEDCRCHPEKRSPSSRLMRPLRGRGIHRFVSRYLFGKHASGRGKNPEKHRAGEFTPFLFPRRIPRYY